MNACAICGETLAFTVFIHLGRADTHNHCVLLAIDIAAPAYLSDAGREALAGYGFKRKELRKMIRERMWGERQKEWEAYASIPRGPKPIPEAEWLKQVEAAEKAERGR